MFGHSHDSHGFQLVKVRASLPASSSVLTPAPRGLTPALSPAAAS